MKKHFAAKGERKILINIQKYRHKNKDQPEVRKPTTPLY
jgi:hypothetical protein